MDKNRGVLLQMAQGIALTETEDVISEALLTTSAEAYSKTAGYEMTTLTQEDGDPDGPFTLAAYARNENTEAEVIWIDCGNMDNEGIYQVLPGNVTFLQACATTLAFEESTTLIESKALEAAPLEVSNSTSVALGLTFVIVLPAAVLVIGLIVGIICGGMNLGIDFTGGTMMTIAMHQDFDSSVVTKAFVDEGFSEKDISLTVSGSGEEAEALVRFPDTNDADRENEIRADVEKTIQATYPNAEVASTDRVGAVAGRDLVMNAISSVLIACALMLVYIWFRFELHFGVTAVVALLLDVGVMISMVTILRLQVNSSFIAAVLTIVGYAINDTIVIFDRIRENMRLHSRKEMTRAELADLSVKETLPRTVNTSITTLLTIVMLYIMGVTSIREFALPIIIGLLAGIYTSVFIAPSLWGVWQDKTDLKKAAAAQTKGKAKAKKA